MSTVVIIQNYDNMMYFVFMAHSASLSREFLIHFYNETKLQHIKDLASKST